MIGLDTALGIVVFLGIAWWMYALSSKSSAERRQEVLRAKHYTRQPWDEDKAGGRGNR